MVDIKRDGSETITFYIDRELKKAFQIKLIQENSSITTKINEWVKDYVNRN